MIILTQWQATAILGPATPGSPLDYLHVTINCADLINLANLKPIDLA